MEVIRHQTVAEQSERLSMLRGPNQIQEASVVTRPVKELDPPRGSVDDMEYQSCRLSGPPDSHAVVNTSFLPEKPTPRVGFENRPRG